MGRLFSTNPVVFAAGMAGAVFLGIAAAVMSADAAGAQAGGVCPANPSPPDASDASIIVERPLAGATVQSPLTVSGRARTFEANVQIRILDADGDVIRETFTMADEGAPTLAPFSAQVPFSVVSKQDACLMVFEGSAQDGRPINVVLVPVVLEGSGAPLPPDTGNAAPAQEAEAPGSDTFGMAVGVGGMLIAIAMLAPFALRRR